MSEMSSASKKNMKSKMIMTSKIRRNSQTTFETETSKINFEIFVC